MTKPITTQLIQKARSIVNTTYALRHTIYRSLGSLAVHRAYTRFIVLGRSRCGSNYLRGLINSHRRAIAFGELFASNASLQWGLLGYPTSANVVVQYRNQPLDFLESHVYGDVPKHIQAVGFKLFYEHARGEKWQPIWEYLAAQPDLKIIHIQRDNMLRQNLSFQKAVVTDQWVNKSGKSEKAPPIHLDYEQCLAAFQRTKENIQKYTQFFRNQPQLIVHYEELVRDSDGQMERVQEFLGLKFEKLKSETYQQGDKPLSEAIANYHELKEQFRGTEWEVFFEE